MIEHMGASRNRISLGRACFVHLRWSFPYSLVFYCNLNQVVQQSSVHRTPYVQHRVIERSAKGVGIKC